MFQHLGKALTLLRAVQGKSQVEVARKAGIGKSQLSKYETGQELPRLDSLEKVLRSLGVGLHDFVSTLAMIDHQAERLRGGDSGPAGLKESAWLLASGGLPDGGMQEAFSRVLQDLLSLQGLILQQLVLGIRRPGDAEILLKGRGAEKP